MRCWPAMESRRWPRAASSACVPRWRSRHAPYMQHAGGPSALRTGAKCPVVCPGQRAARSACCWRLRWRWAAAQRQPRVHPHRVLALNRPTPPANGQASGRRPRRRARNWSAWWWCSGMACAHRCREAAAAHYADQPWPQWSTPASLLTPHGRKGVQLSGEYLRQWLAQQALLPSSGCPATGSVSVWANTDQRTIDSGALLADALAPGCGIVAGHREAGSNDPLFRPIEAGAVPFDATAAVASIQQQTGALPPCCKATPPSCRHCSRFWAARGRPAISRRCLPHWRRRPTGVALD